MFTFSEVKSEQVKEIILKLNPRKSVSGPITVKLLQMVADIVSEPITSCLNAMIKSSSFPHILKLAEVTPVYKKKDKFLKENYRPISVLPALSKVFERVILKQLTGYFDGILHPNLCGFRSKHNTQHALLQMIGKWNKCSENSGRVGAILMDLSKAFDCIDHELLIAKLAAYGLDHSSLKLLKCYLSNRFQKTKVGSFFSFWIQIPQGSILGPLLFKFFYKRSDISHNQN